MSRSRPRVQKRRVGLALRASALDLAPAIQLQHRCFFDLTSLRITAIGLTIAMTVYPFAVSAQTAIVPSGRTATTVTTNGNVSTVTTRTISGANAFNSFSQFRVGRGDTGNLILPNGTSNLINLMSSNDPAVINGVLNAYKDGQIGGNVYFASSGGFIVGRSGVVNTGSLHVTTPTREFVDGVVGSSGQINQGAVNNLLAGTVPISPDGNIRIRGRINAIDAVRLTGQNVFIGDRNRVNADHAAKFASSVNSRGLRSANGIVVHNGSIQIVAMNDAKINARVAARRGGTVKVDAGHDVSIGSKAKISADHKSGAGGSVAVNAGHDIVVSGYGVLSAKSIDGDAGTVRVIAGHSLTVEAGAAFDASSAQGNGGIVELSSFGTFHLQNGFTVNASAPHGRAGTLVMDPTDVVVGDPVQDNNVTLSNADVVAAVSALSAGVAYSIPSINFTVAAHGVIDTLGHDFEISTSSAGSITIDGLIDTRNYAGAQVTTSLSDASRVSAGSSGGVSLSGSNITISSTGKVLADVNNTTGTGATSYTAGAVTLTASVSDNQGLLPSSATSLISIAGTVTGASITATAKADAVTSPFDSAAGLAEFAAGTLIGGVLAGINGGYVKSEGTAKVTVEGTAKLTASGAITLASSGSEKASDPVVALDGQLQNSVGAAVVVGIVNADVATQIKANAQISAGDLTVLASNKAELNVTSLVFTTSTPIDATVAYSTGTVNTKALIDPGASISKVGNITVAAQNQNSYSTSATSLAGGTGSAAFAVAISDVTSHAVANLGASIPQTAGANAITVYSGNNTIKNAVSASSTVGSPYLLRNILSLGGGGGTSSLFSQPAAGQSGLLEQAGIKESTDAQGTTAAWRAGLTLALNQPTLTSTASIAAVAPDVNGNMAASGSTPNIVASGNVGVISVLVDSAVRGNAGTSVESNPQGTPADPTTKRGISMAVAVTDVTETSNAYIDSSVSLTAARIGVSASTLLPITNTWLDFATFKDVQTEITDLMSHANGNLGIVNNILTTYANATAESASFGFAGAVNYFNVVNNTVAWVGSGATLTQTATGCAVSATCWSSTLNLTTPSPSSFDLAGLGAPSTFDWGHDVEVQATTTTQSINIGGNFSWLTVFGSNSSSNTGTAIGGSANVNIFESHTVAGIGAGATVNATGSLDVDAKTVDLIYAVAPTSGKGSGMGLNGVVSVLQLDNDTSASISNTAKVTATAVNVGAEQHISSFDIGGGVGYSKGTGIGLVAAVASMSADTSAFIGDNSTALSSPGLTGDDLNVTPSGAGFVSALSTSVAALSVGRLTTVAVAASASNNSPNPTDPQDVKDTQPAPDGYLDKALFYLKSGYASVSSKISKAIDDLKKASDPVNGGNSVAGAGSTAVDLTNINTSASVAGATLKNSTVSDNTVSVQALNNTIIDTATGAAALAKGVQGTDNTVGIAGAVAVTMSSDMTTANISQSSVTAKDTTVQALAGGESTTIGLAVALTSSSGNSDQASVSVSIAEVNNGVQANVDSSTLGQGAGGNFGDLTIIADQKTNIGIGAGSLYGGFGGDSTKKGLGVAFTYAAIGDPSDGAAVSAVLSNSKVDNTRSLIIEALDTSRIASGAAVGGGGANSNGFAGSVIVNDIDPTILAEITTDPAVAGRLAVTGGITVTDEVTVIASSGSNGALDTIIANAAISSNGGLAATSDSNVDFTGADLSPTSTTGAAILAVAGNVQVGKSNVGVSIVVNRVGTKHEALVDKASVTSTGGVVNVSALDSTEIIGVAVGIGGSNGSVAGTGSVAYNAINNAVVAQIGHGTSATDTAGATTATVDAAAVQVVAQDSARIRGASGAISINIGGGNAVGLSAVVDMIETYVSAGVAGATVTADNDFVDNSALVGASLPAGSVRVAGSSDADIITVAIGAAVSRGNAPATAQENLSSLVALMRPLAPTQLKGFGSNGVATPSPAPTAPRAPDLPTSNGVSGSGSFAISTEATSVYSTITKGGNNTNSQITADNSVLVGASNTDNISAYAGALSASINSGKGLGASVVVNKIDSTTSAGISDSTVDAHATGNAATIDNATLANAIDPTDAQTPASDPNLSNGTTTINGVAVFASSQQAANTVAAVLSASNQGTAIAANTITNVMGGTTEANIKSSSINKNLVSGEASVVRVTASSASYANNLDVGIAGSSQGAAGTIVLIINMMDRTTTASIDSTDIGSSTVSAGPVVVLANAFQATAGEAVGAALSGNSAGVTGSSLVNTFQSTTTASLDHGTVYSNGLSVTANGKNGFFAAIGSGAIGSSAGIGATVMVATSDNTVKALVGDIDPLTAATTLHLAGALDVKASNETDTSSYVIVAGLGGTAGIAAQFSGIIITNTVQAEINNTSVPTTGAVTVSATENDSIAPVTGGLAGGGTAGIGAAVNLVILKSNTTALLAGDTITAGSNDVTVSALSTRDVNPITVIASLAGQVGIAGTVGVVLIGSGASSDEMSVLNSGSNGGDPNSGTLGNAGQATGTNVVAATGSGVDGISAQILGGSVTAHKVDVNAKAKTQVRNIVGALAVGISGAGFGAAVGFTEVDQKVTAKAAQGSLTSPTVSISASAADDGGHAAESWGIAGAGGLYVGIGAAVGKSVVNNEVTAELGSTTDGGTGGGSSAVLAVNATDTSSLASYGYGFAAGAGAVGLALGFSEKSSTVTADLAPSTTVTNFSDVSVKASGSGSVYSETIAGAAGIVSGAGSSANASDSETIKAEIGHDSHVSAAGPNGTLVDARATPQVSTKAYGVAAGSVGIGASVSLATAAANVQADVDDRSTISDGKLLIAASVLVPSGDHSANAYAVGAGGGVLMGLQATNAVAENDSTAKAYGGKDLHLPSADVSITSQTNTDQYANGTGIAVGYVGAGETFTQTTSDTHSNAWLDSGAVTASSNLGVLTITASGSDNNKSDSLAGSGGVIAGAAAIGITSATADVTATLKDSAASDTLYFGGFGVGASHTATYEANGNAFQASALGASGGSANNTVTSTVKAEVGSNYIINSAGGDMKVVASDTVNQTAGGAVAGSGGVAAGAATLSDATVTQTVTAHVAHDTIFSLNADPYTTLAAIDIEALSFLNTVDSVSLDAGGLFAGGGAHSTMDGEATNSVQIDDGVTLFSAGNLYIGTAARMNAANNANAKLYGLVTGAGASTNSALKAKQDVTIGNSRVEAWGIINIYAGQSGNGYYTTDISANGTTNVYNYAVIPITAEYKGQSSAESRSTLTLSTGSKIYGANNIFLGADPGNVVSNGNGTSHNPYLELFSKEDHDNAGASPVKVGDVILNGSVVAGIHNEANVSIDYNGNVTLTQGASPVSPLTLVSIGDPNGFSPIVTYNSQKIQWATVGSFNAHDDAVSSIASLSGLTSAQVNDAVANNQPITALNDDASGTKQRQINTLIQQLPYLLDAGGPAFKFGNILASAGNVSILAMTLKTTGGTPSVVAHDSVKISFDNEGTKFLFPTGLFISGVTGGKVNFTGQATSENTTGITFTQDTDNKVPSIIVEANYSATNANKQPIDQNGNLLLTTPDIYFGGEVINVNGLLSVKNQLGNVLITRDMRVGTVSMTVPNGMIGGSLGANSIYNTNYDVAAQWNDIEYRPTNILTAVEAAATYLGSVPFAPGGPYIDGNQNYTPYYYFTNECGGGCSPNPSVVTGFGDPSQLFTARMLALYYDSHSLYSAIFLPVATTGDISGAISSSGGRSSQWQRHDFQGWAYPNSDSGPFNCSGCAKYFQIVDIQNQVLNGVTSNHSNVTPSSSLITAGKAMILSADVININGNISVGQSSDFSVNIGVNAQNKINSIRGDDGLLAAAKADAAAGKYVDLSGYVTSVNGSDVKVTAKYNAATDQILLDPVIQGTGGFVYLNGRIISTSPTGNPMGNITVHGGAGTVTINNTTDTTLVTNVINTGVSAASVIEFVDHAAINSVGGLGQTTWYVYNAGASPSSQVSIYRQDGVNNGGYNALVPAQTTANSGLSYTPAAQLYQWDDTARMTRPDISDMTQFGWTFNGTNAFGPVFPWGRSAPRVVAGSQATNFSEYLTATGALTTYSVATGNADFGTDFKNGTWYQERYYDLTLTAHNSVKANFPIGIGFTGGGTSNIAVNSTASIIVNNHINNLQGNTSLTATGTTNGLPSSITAGADAFVSGVNVTLSAPGGVGTLAKPLPVSTFGGVLSASSTDHDIALAASGPVIIGSIFANTGQAYPQGNIFLSATGDITQSAAYNGTPVIVGKSVTINTSGGAIGAKSGVDQNGNATLANINPITIQATATALGDGTFDGGILNSSSSAGTYIVQAIGDLRLGVISSNGPVFLAAMAVNNQPANILNGLTTGGLTKEQLDYLKSVQTQLDLLGTANGNGPAASVVAYQKMIEGSYRDYWQLHNLAFFDGVNFSATTSATTLDTNAIKTQLAAQLGVAVTAITDQQIQAEVANREAPIRTQLAAKASAACSCTVDVSTITDQQVLAEAANRDLGRKVIATQLATKLGVDVSTITDQQVQAEATNRFNKDQYLLGLKTVAQLGTTLDALFGVAPGQTVQFQQAVLTSALSTALDTFDANFTYTLPSNSQLYADMSSGSKWTQDQLTYVVSANGVAAPSIESLPLNVSGRQVMLYAPKGNIGNLAAPNTFSFTGDGSTPLTPEQKALMASAGPGQLTVTTSIINGLNGPVNKYDVSIAQRSLVKVSPLGTISAKALNQIYLGSASDMLLGGIPDTTFGPISAAISAGVQTIASGEVLLQAIGSIKGGVTGQVAISGVIDQLTLIAETGSIGLPGAAGSDPATNNNALLLAISGSVFPVATLDQAQATHGIYIRQTTGDLVLGKIDAGSGADSALQLAASASIYAESQLTDRNVSFIAASALDLRASGDISFNGGAFQPLQVKISGAVTGSAGGKLTLLSPNANMTIGAPGAFGNLTSPGVLALEVDAGNLTINANVTSGAALQLIANNAVIFGAGTSGAPVVAQANGDVTLAATTLTMGAFTGIDATGTIAVSTTGDATLGKLSSSQAFASSGTAITVAAGGPASTGSIFSNGDGRDNVLTTGVNAGVSLTASGDIGAPATPVIVDTPTLVFAAGGGAFLTAIQALHVTSGVATAGAMSIQGDPSLVLDTLASGRALSAISNDGAITIGTATSGGSQTIYGKLDVAFTTLTTNGIVGDPGDVAVTSGAGKIEGTTVAANGSASLRAATTNKGTSVSGTTGSVDIRGTNLVNWTTLNAGTTINILSSNDAVAFDTATSGGSQTIHGKLDVTFTAATAGIANSTLADISVTSDTGKIEATTVAAYGSAALHAATTNKGSSVSGTIGSVDITGTNLVNWTTLNAGTTINILSSNDAVVLDTATSGGTQTIHGKLDVTFATLTTNGIVGDPGDVSVISDTGKIAGTTVAANGSAALQAATTNIGDSLTATTGDATLTAGGLIDWNTIVAGKTITVTSSNDSIVLGTATSGGSQTMEAFNDITFDRLETTGIPGDRGSINLHAINGKIVGTELLAHGDVGLESKTDLTLTHLRGDAVTLQTPQDIAVNQLDVISSMTLGADTIDVTAMQIPSVPPIPLHVVISGYHGGVATLANVVIDPPQVIIDQFRVVDSTLTVDSPFVNIVSGFVPGQMFLSTPTADILLNNRTPAPVGGVNLQLYQPGGNFSMMQSGNTNMSNTQVVYYDQSISSVITNYGGGNFGGSSFVRDSQEDMQNGGAFDPANPDKSGLASISVLGQYGLRLNLEHSGAIQVIGDGPAVNIEGLTEANEVQNTDETNKKQLKGKQKSSWLDGMRNVAALFEAAQ